MATVVVEDANNRTEDMEGAYTATSIGSGQGGGIFAEAIYQGAQTWGRKIGGVSLLRGFLIDITEINMELLGGNVLMWKASLVNSAAIDPIGLQARIGSAITNYNGYVIHDDGTQGDDGEFAYPIKDAWIIAPIDPNEEAWVDSSVGVPNPILTDELSYAGAITITTNNENMIADAADVSTGLFLTRGDSTEPDGTFQDLIDDDEGEVTDGRFGHFSTRDGIIFVFGSHVVGRTPVGSVANPTVFTDTLRTLVFPGGRVGVGWNKLEFDLSHADTVINLDTITVEGKGRTDLLRFFDSELEVNGTTEVITIVAHGFSSGDFVTYSAEGGTVVTGLTDNTGFFVANLTVDTIALYAIGVLKVGRQNSFTDTSRVGLTAASAGTGERHSLRRIPDTRPDLNVTSDLMVAVSEDGTDQVMTSRNGIDWTVRTEAEAAAEYRDVTEALGTFVAVAATGTDRVMTSTDGITWANIAAAAAETWEHVTFGAGLFVAVSLSGEVMTSPTGATWSSRTTAEANSWQGVAFGNGTFVAVASDGTNRVMTSADGITWATQTAAAANAWQSVAFGNGVFVAVSDTGTNKSMVSKDGVTWVDNLTDPSGTTWQDIIFADGLFMAFGIGVDQRAMTSEDGITWRRSEPAPLLNYRSVTHAAGSFVAVASNGINDIVISVDGRRWLDAQSTEANIWNGITTLRETGNGTFDAVTCVFNAMRRLRLHVDATLTSCQIVGSKILVLAGGTLDLCSFSSPSTFFGEAFLDAALVADLANVTDCAFTSGGFGHATVVRDGPGAVTFSGNTHAGYGPGSVGGAGAHDHEFDSTSDVNATTDVITLPLDNFVTGDAVFYSDEGGSADIGLVDGNLYFLRRDSSAVYGIFETSAAALADSNRIALTSTGAETQVLYSANAAFHNRTGGTVTLNVADGGDAPSVRNSNGSVTIINNNVSLTFTGMKDNTEVRVYTANTTTELDGVENAVDGSTDDRSVTFALASGISVDVRFMNQDFIVPDRNSILDLTWPSTTSSIPITQIVDRTFNNPA